MDKDKQEKTDVNEADVLKLIEGITPVDPKLLVEFQRAMNEKVIPEIVKVVEARRVLAAKSRQWQLKC
jgi:hypothetical protein